MTEDDEFSAPPKLLIKTIQIQPIRSLFLALKDIITDITMIITPDEIKILDMDKSLTVLVCLFLKSSKFESYHCEPEQIITSFNTSNMFRIISTITNDDIFTMYISEQDYNHGIVKEIGFNFKNTKINEVRDFKLKLLEPSMELLAYPGVNFNTVIHMVSSDFQKLVRDLNNISSDKVEIQSVGNNLYFRSSGLAGSVTMTRTQSATMSFTRHTSEDVVVRGVFSLKSLTQFTKCTPLSVDMELYLDNIKPIVVKYNVGSLGEIRLCLSQLPRDI